MTIPTSKADRMIQRLRASQPDRPPCVEVVDPAVAAVLREKTGWERLEIANGMWRSARRLITDAIRRDHPDWDAATVDREVARRMSLGMD